MVGNPAAEHAQGGAHEGRQHGELARLHFARAELVVKITRQEGDQADEAAKGHCIDQAEGPAVLLEQAGGVLLEAGMLVQIRRLLGKHDHDDHWQQHCGGGKTVDRLPAKGLGQRRREQGGHSRAHIASAHQAHGHALVARRKRA